MNRKVVAIIMEGGEGKRMGTRVPNVLHKVDGVPMINRIVLTLHKLSYFVHLEKVIIVAGKNKDAIKASIDTHVCLPKIIYVTQDEPLGTGNAVMCCEQELMRTPGADVLVLSGDVPLVSTRTLIMLIENTCDVKLITTTLTDPIGYGRIITTDNVFTKIVEQKDCHPHQLHICRVNCGIYCMKSGLMCKYFRHLTNNNSQSEYYLTDLIGIIKEGEGIYVGMLEIDANNLHESMGIDATKQLNKFEKLIKKN
jgi:bifunctional UDP-N-acetylglucosamine pyrophosphorylase/glucosamine-1-phosphate N-acetyltransferase